MPSKNGGIMACQDKKISQLVEDKPKPGDVFPIARLGGNFSVDLATILSMGLFRKEKTANHWQNPTDVAWLKTGDFSVSTSTKIWVEVGGSLVKVDASTPVTMTTPVPGVDYAIWCNKDGELEAMPNQDNEPPSEDVRKIGGFHYAPGGNASGRSGGDSTPQINEYSFWDLKFRPSCPDPRGMTLVANGFWSDIYLTGSNATGIDCSSVYNTTIADGSNPPSAHGMFGGGSYGSYTWFDAMELGTSFGKKNPTQMEFMSLAYGSTEKSSLELDPISTVLNPAYTSKWGVIQATGVLWVWARDRGGPFYTASWNSNTEERGSEFNAPNSCILGGAWNTLANSGTRCSNWEHDASYSNETVGSRFVCDHLQID